MANQDWKRQKIAEGLRGRGKAGSPQRVVEAAKPTIIMSTVADAFEAPKGSLDCTPEEYRQLERERQLLEEAIRTELREQSLKNFWFFLTRVLFPDTWKQHYTVDFHKPICDQIQNLDQGQDIWLILGRESRKSFVADIARHIWMIVKDPNIRLLLVGAREETVKPFARVIRSAFVKGTPGFEKFQWVFPEFIYDEGDGGKFLKQQFQFDCKLKTRPTPDPTFRAVYLGVTGAGFRADQITFDDPIERRNVTSPEMSLKTLSQMMDLYPLLDMNSKYGNVIGCGTRYAYHDPIGKIIGDTTEDDPNAADSLKRIQERNAIIIVRHAFEDANRPCEHCPAHVMAKSPHGHPSFEGDPVIHPIHTRDMLMARYNQYLADPSLGEAMFWHQYMNVCLAPGNQKIKPEWFHRILQPTWPTAKRRVLAIDSADKDFQRAGIGDWMVALFGEWEETGRLCIVHGIRSNSYTRDEFQRHILTWCIQSSWWPGYVIKEKVGNDSFLTDMGLRFLNQNRPLTCMAIPKANQKDAIALKKYDWIIGSIQAPLERGEVVWGSLCPAAIVERAKYEATHLSQTAHDDVADTLALFFDPKVRVLRAERPGRPAFAWDSPFIGGNGLGLENPSESTIILNGKNPTLGQARDAAKVKEAFFGLGDYADINWDGATPERSAFGFAVYE